MTRFHSIIATLCVVICFTSCARDSAHTSIDNPHVYPGNPAVGARPAQEQWRYGEAPDAHDFLGDRTVEEVLTAYRPFIHIPLRENTLRKGTTDHIGSWVDMMRPGDVDLAFFHFVEGSINEQQRTMSPGANAEPQVMTAYRVDQVLRMDQLLTFLRKRHDANRDGVITLLEMSDAVYETYPIAYRGGKLSDRSNVQRALVGLRYADANKNFLLDTVEHTFYKDFIAEVQTCYGNVDRPSRAVQTLANAIAARTATAPTHVPRTRSASKPAPPETVSSATVPAAITK